MRSKSYIPFILLLFLTLTVKAQQSAFFRKADQFFQQYVGDGLVKYRSLSNNPKQLERLTSLIAKVEKPKDPKVQKAFYINSYNILAIQQVVNHYPVESPKDIPGFFDGIAHKVHGQPVTLDELENDLLFGAFDDPHLHFALICAAKGCPPIKAGAFQAGKLDQQLDKQTSRSLSDPDFIRHQPGSRQATVSPILKWYRDDFLTKANSLLDYINQFREKVLPADTRLQFYDYDWSLNEKGIEQAKKPTASRAGSQNLIRQSSGYILNEGGLELIFFNNLYTQDQFFNSSWEKQSLNTRTSFYAGIMEALYGLGSRVNVGFDAFYEAVREGNCPINTLAFEKTPNAHHALTGIMPKVKVAPFEGFRAITVESGVFIPTANDPEANNHDRPFLANDDFEWWNEVFYVNNISPKFQLFTELNTIWRMDEDGAFSDQSAVRTPARVFMSWFPKDQWSFYGMAAFNPTWSGQGLSSAFYQNGVGVKYQMTNTLEIEGLYTNFLLGKNSGAGQTFNIGLRFQR